jgi:hypothetical protein
MADKSESKLDELIKRVEHLAGEVADLKKKPPAPDVVLSELAALSPCGFVPTGALPIGPWSLWWLMLTLGAPLGGLGGNVVVPGTLRIAAARAAAVARALEHAAKVREALSKAPSGATDKHEFMQQVFREILSQTPAERKVMAEFMRSFWQGNAQSK